MPAQEDHGIEEGDMQGGSPSQYYCSPEVDRIWRGEFSNEIPIYPTFYLLTGDYNTSYEFTCYMMIICHDCELEMGCNRRSTGPGADKSGVRIHRPYHK